MPLGAATPGNATQVVNHLFFFLRSLWSKLLKSAEWLAFGNDYLKGGTCLWVLLVLVLGDGLWSVPPIQLPHGLVAKIKVPDKASKENVQEEKDKLKKKTVQL